MLNFKKTKKITVLIAAAVALLAVSVSAAVLWLTPDQVAEGVGLPLLAEAFTGEDAIIINETQESGEFAITLLGMVSGENLDMIGEKQSSSAVYTGTASGVDEDEIDGEADQAHTYAVLAVSRLDGTPLDDPEYDENGDPVDEDAFNAFDYTITPLVAGYSPAGVNCWTLGAAWNGYPKGGVYYYLLDTASIEMFADHTVYMAFYKGGVPNNYIFTVNDDGTIAFCDDFDEVHALFTLPLDPAKADPAAVAAFIAEYDMGWTNERAPIVEKEEKPEFRRTLDPMTPEEFEAYMAGEIEQLQAWLDAGDMLQEAYDMRVQILEEQLAGIKDGTLIAAMSESGSVATATAPTDGRTLIIEETQDGIMMTQVG